ncbi:hypothetical protein PV11_07503 [Exophiala sideris]|uniref:Uncharacterized protein n=1 Tax=Exophiala sideris TaxID=1016849 RepID=A0A0D1VUU1_9EURO|nr:hypothetical protein PV11_07503 [Exophiala sideris]
MSLEAVNQKETRVESHTEDLVSEDAKNLEDQVVSTTATGEEANLRGDSVDDMAAVDKTTLPPQDKEARTPSHAPSVDAVDDLDTFKTAARTLLSIHRDEIAQRDEQISKLRGELLRVREGLQALEKQSVLGEPFQDSDGFGDNQELGKDSSEQVKSISDWSLLDLSEKEQVVDMNAHLTESSNSASTQRMRTMLVLALVAKALEEYVLTPNYLLEDDDELRYILSRMTDTRKKAQFRSLLLSIAEGDGLKEPVKLFRVETALNSIMKPFEAMFQEDFRDKLRSRLEQLLEGVMTAWEPVQHYESHLEVSTVAKVSGRQWMSLHFGGDRANLVMVNSDVFETDPVLMVVFPKVCVIDRSKKSAFTTVFPGVVFQKSQATIAAADAEVKGIEIPAILDTEPLPTQHLEGMLKGSPDADEADSRVTGSDSDGSSASGDETDGGSETESNDGDGEA